jgi:pimeloyl-ACP methyl ester carboxylesterase
MHPRLLKSLVVIEPVIVPDTFSGHGHILSLKSLKRQDTWPSRSAAIKAAQKTYKTWDPRVLERWIQNGYRNLPTALYPQEGTNENVRPSSDDPSVTLTSSKHQEVMQYVRANFEGHMPLGQEDHTKGRPPHDPLGKPDIVGPSDAIVPFYRSEPLIAWRLLDHIRPSVLYVMGGRSPVSTSRIRSELLHRTGAGIGGSGGLKNLQVKEVVFEKSGHQLPLEQVKETASAIGEWIKPVVQRWKEDEKRIAREWNNQSTRDRLSVPTEWMPALEVICKSLVRSSKM